MTWRIAWGLFALLMAVFLAPHSVRADDVAAAQAAIHKFSYPGSDGWFTPMVKTAERKAFARAIQNVCQVYRDEVPSLTPEETTWIQEELGHSGARLTAAINSPLYPRFRLSNVFDECIQFGKVISNVEGADIGENWVSLALTLNEGEFFDLFLRFGRDGNNTPAIAAVDVITKEIVNTIIRRVLWPKVKW
jgi:hypothetical protein